MKTSNKFQETILEHLKYRAFTDPLFAKTFAKPNKNIEECCTYILNQVKSSGQNGFDDAEIFGMAIHYYDEDDIKIGEKFNGQVVVNHKPILTSAEKEEAKAKALEEVVAEEKAKLRKKPVKKKVEKEKTTDKPNDGVIDLFA